MTLNGVIVLILRHFAEFDSFGAYYFTVVEDRPYCLQNVVFQLWPKVTHPPCSAVSAIAELLVNLYCCHFPLNNV